jgi:IS30 family transposase
MRPHLTVEQRQLALRLKARGLSLREIGPQVDCSHQGVALVVRQASRRPVRHDGWTPGPGRLTLADREEITLGLHAGESFTAIAARLGKAVSTVSREVAANGGRDGYLAWRAHQRAREQARLPKPCKLASTELAAQVVAWLEQWWLPTTARPLSTAPASSPPPEPSRLPPACTRAGSAGAAARPAGVPEFHYRGSV